MRPWRTALKQAVNRRRLPRAALGSAPQSFHDVPLKAAGFGYALQVVLGIYFSNGVTLLRATDAVCQYDNFGLSFKVVGNGGTRAAEGRWRLRQFAGKGGDVLRCG